MANIYTNAAIPAQPSIASYPASALQLFPQYTRASYLAAFGIDAATYDSTKKP
jgi:hypothetical protein